MEEILIISVLISGGRGITLNTSEVAETLKGHALVLSL